MNLEFLSAPVLLLGLGATALALFLLQRLRVRHREQAVVTTLFWRQAVEEARARVLVRRFRHPLAYLLFLGIAALLWLGISGLRTGGGDAREQLLLIDGSVAMADDAARATAHRALESAAADSDPDHTRVLWVGDRIRTLLVPGEDPLVLAERLRALTPAAVPSRLAEVARGMTQGSARALDVHCFGPAVPAGAEGGAAKIFQAHTVEATTGPEIRVLGLAPAHSGRSDAVDIRLVVAGTAALPQIQLDGAAITQPLIKAGEGTSWRIEDLPAHGGRLRVQLGEGVQAAVRLPDRRPIRVQLDPALADRLATVLEMDPGLERVAADATDAQVAIRSGPVAASALPTLWFAPAEEREAFVLRMPEGTRDEATRLREGFEALGLEWIDARQLAQAARREIRMTVETSDSRSLVLWRALLGAEFDFTADRAFPLFVARSLRWLADAEPLLPYVAAGEALPQDIGVLVDARGLLLDAMGAAAIPPQAGAYQVGTRRLEASVLRGPQAQGEPAEAAPASSGFSGGTAWTGLLLLLAFALLWIEWTLYRTERVP